MKVEYEWKLEVLVKSINKKTVILRARTKQMHDEWGTWREEDGPREVGEGETLTFSFPYTMSLPEGAKLT